MSAHRGRVDQFDEGNPACGHACEMAAVLPTAGAASMTSRRFPPPWHADPVPGGYVVRDANGQALAYLYSRQNPRRVAVNIARLPELLGKVERE